MKIIFLDIDGVLNTLNHLRRQKSETGVTSNKNWSPIACKHITLLCRELGARIVLISSWRHEFSLVQIKEFFEANEIPSKYLIDRTPSTAPQPDGQNYCRGHEIQYWIDTYPDEVKSYIIIDDEASFLEHQEKNLIRVNKETGFSTKELAKRAAYILNLV